LHVVALPILGTEHSIVLVSDGSVIGIEQKVLPTAVEKSSS